MWNRSEVPLLFPAVQSSDRLLQPLWDHIRFHYRPLVSSPFFPVLLAFSAYIFFSVPFATLDLLGEKAPSLYRYKIQKGRRPTARMMAVSLSRAVYNHLVFVVPAVLINSYIVPAPPLPTLAPTVREVLVGGLGALLVFDTQYFIWHLVHHKNRHLYRWVHAVHHDFVAPFSWSTQHLSAMELLTVGFWSNMDPILLRCHPLTTWSLTLFSIWMSVEDHIGYDMPWTLHRLVPLGLLGGAPAHDLHHQRPSSNYAPFFAHWDRIFGTAARLEAEKTLLQKECDD
ncbi:cholesterol 25-hydroxylase-like protein 1, member 1 [Megalops cyprinoides]|uniref:cholesterol 25-hydroxylase-like protein 1, member 1 n=1 Tax=Megalops cyprinoides TaxID=118141 RepID=UPI0018649D2F|nr:cholesterol 25-hydroxylase-like protein 1, member 1 [Megalops cyprinoides]